jgi:hypothetical protein
MPTDLTGLLIFIITLSPGFCYTLRRERMTANRSISAFRETITVMLSSVLSVAFTLAVFAMIRAAFPQNTPNIGRLIREPATYFREKYEYLTSWGVLLLAAACIISVIAAQVPAWWRLHDTKSLLPRWLAHHAGMHNGVAFVSSWWRLFESHPEKAKLVTCKLEDGSAVQGVLHSYSSDGDETPDRELILGGPLAIRDSTGRIFKDDYGGLSVSARRIMYLYVDYIDPFE